MERFKELKFKGSPRFNNKKEMRVEMGIPGVNSGVYDKEMYIQVIIKQPGFFKQKSTSCTIRINPKQIEELRDECNKILALNTTT